MIRKKFITDIWMTTISLTNITNEKLYLSACGFLTKHGMTGMIFGVDFMGGRLTMAAYC